MGKTDCGLLLDTVPEFAWRDVRRITAVVPRRIFLYDRLQLEKFILYVQIQGYWISIPSIRARFPKCIFRFPKTGLRSSRFGKINRVWISECAMASS
jgi:hypothetical protein